MHGGFCRLISALLFAALGTCSEQPHPLGGTNPQLFSPLPGVDYSRFAKLLCEQEQPSPSPFDFPAEAGEHLETMRQRLGLPDQFDDDKGMYQDALEDDDPEWQKGLGDMQSACGLSEQAEKSLLRALRTDPSNANYLLSYGKHLAANHEYAQAEGALSCILTQHPDNAEALQELEKLGEQLE